MSATPEDITAATLDDAHRAEGVRETLEKAHDLHLVIIEALINQNKDGELTSVVRVLEGVAESIWDAKKHAKHTENMLYQQYWQATGQVKLQEVAA